MLRNSLVQLIEAHQRLETPIREHREHFLSDWNTEHPFVRKFLSPRLWKLLGQKSRASRYIYFDEQQEILDSIRAFHMSVERLFLRPANVIAGPGTTSLLTAFCLWLLQRGEEEAFYIPPVYYTMHFMLRTLKIRTRPVSSRQAFESDCHLRLPRKRTVLLLTDPVWFAGKRVPERQLKQIADWQNDTGSLVFVDGSFQYTQWNRSRFEFTSALNADQTFRVVSPTKSLAIPGFRFAYLLLPAQFHESLLFLYESLVGSASLADLMFAKQSLAVLNSKGSNRILTDFLQGVYEELTKKGIIRTAITPECGYFVFAKVNSRLKNQVLMGEDYFELKRYPDYARVNLLKADAVFSKSRGPRSVQ